MNIKHRLEYNTDAIKPLLEKVRFDENVSEEDSQRIQKWRKGSMRLEHALLQLDDLMMLYNDF